MVLLKARATFENLNSAVREGAIRQARIENTLATLDVPLK